jgi:hypothetical protein
MNHVKSPATIRLAAALLLSMGSFGLHAESRLQAVQVEAAFELACADAVVPGQQEIARRFDVANFSKAYDLRNRMQHVLTRVCHSGADRVRFALDTRGEKSELRFVAMQD